MTASASVLDTVAQEVLAWPGVTASPGRFGATEFHLGRRELGHLHGDAFADLPMTRARRDELIAAGRAQAHHHLPDSGWITVPITGPDDAPALVALMRENLERALAARERAEARAAASPAG